MSILNFVFLAVPVLFLVASVLIASKAVTHGKSRKRTLLMQLASFGAVFAVCMIFPLMAGAAADTTAVDVAKANANGILSARPRLRLSAPPARIPRRLVRQSSLLRWAKASRCTAC